MCHHGYLFDRTTEQLCMTTLQLVKKEAIDGNVAVGLYYLKYKSIKKFRRRSVQILVIKTAQAQLLMCLKMIT